MLMLDDLVQCIIFLGIFFSPFSCLMFQDFFKTLLHTNVSLLGLCVAALRCLGPTPAAPEPFAKVSTRSQGDVLAVAVLNALMTTAGYFGNKHRLSL